MKNILMFWPRFFSEALITRKYAKAVNGIKDEITKLNLRIDWIGRVYGIVEIREEFKDQPELVQQSMVFQELAPVNDMLLKYGLSDLSYPDIRKISNGSFLVILYPENDHFNLISFIRNVLFMGILTGTVFGITSIIKMFL
ncbi:hypothetical protein N8Z10_00840 [bacterium]|nr:hypothetical protein [bacterium]